MKKRLMIAMLIVWSSLFGIFSLSATGNRVEVVGQSDAIRELDPNGMVLYNNINMEESDLVNGNIAIEITIDNSKKTEVIYVIDNSKTLSNFKSNLIDNFKINSSKLENMDNIKQGIIMTTDGNIMEVPLDNKNIADNLEAVKNINVANNNGEIFTSIERASISFSDEAKEKIMVIALSSLPNDITGLKEKIDNYINNGIKIIVYGINVNDTSNFTNIFNSSQSFLLTNDNLSEIQFAEIITSVLPKERPTFAVSISFDNYILNNFNINTSNIQATNGVAHYDASTNEIIWEVGKVNSNQIVKLNYVLSLKQYVDPSFIGKTLRTNRQIKIIQSGNIDAIPKDDEVEHIICSPTIKLLQESIDNPKTGVVNYIVFGACLLMVSGITIIFLNKKNQFNRI